MNCTLRVHWDDMTLNNVTVSKVNTGGLLTEWIEGYSKANVKFKVSDVTLLPGETIDYYDVVCAGRTFKANAQGNAVTGAMAAGTNTLVCTVHGTKGESSSLTVTVTAFGYIPPTAKYTVIRCNASGTATDSGAYLKITATVIHSLCGGANTALTRVRWKEKSAASYIDSGNIQNDGSLIVGGSVTIDKTYELKLSLSDVVGNTAEYTHTVPSNFWAVKFSDDGHGMSVGKNTAASGYFSLASGMSFQMGSTTLTEAQLKKLIALI